MIKTIYADSEYGSFLISADNVSYINGLRRVMMRDIPTLAITNVEIITNTSIHHDMYLADRIKLLVLKQEEENTENEEFTDLSKTYTFNVEIKNPNYEETHEVKSDELFSFSEELSAANNSVIVKLKNDEIINMNITASYGTGQEHSKFSPVCSVTFMEKEDKKDDEMTKYVLTVESVGGMNPLTILKKAINIIINKLACLIESKEKQERGDRDEKEERN